MRSIKTFVIMMLMLLSITAYVSAEDNTSETDIALNSMQVRYEHLQCKVEFTNNQVELIDEYTNIGGLDNVKEDLEDDLEALKDILDDGNISEFNNYLESTFRPDMVNATQALNRFKKDFRKYNLTTQEREEIKEELKALKDIYNDCVADKTRKIAEVRKRHYEFTDKRWSNIINNMDKLNISTEQLEDIRTMLQEQEEKLDDAIDSGNQTLIRETLQQIMEEHKHLWANFEIARLNGYMNKMDGMAQKYGMNDKMGQMREKLHELENYTEPGYKYGAGDAKKVWQGLHETGKDMRETSKDMLKQRMQENKGREMPEGKGRK